MPPALELGAARRILRDALGVEASLAPLAGERDQNFRADAADGGRWLLKISNPADGASVVDMQTAALRHIEGVDPGLAVMRALPTTGGEPWTEVSVPDGRIYPVRLFTFLPGHITAASALTAPVIWSFGGDHGAPWACLAGVLPPLRRLRDPLGHQTRAKAPPLLAHLDDAPRRAQLERVLDRFEAHAAPALPYLRAQVIHGDMSLDNVLFDRDARVSGIVDFGDMSHAPLVCDLAVAIADVLHGRDDDIEAAEPMIGGYVSVTPVEDDEAEQPGTW